MLTTVLLGRNGTHGFNDTYCHPNLDEGFVMGFFRVALRLRFILTCALFLVPGLEAVAQADDFNATKSLAMQGDAEAQCNLGYIYEDDWTSRNQGVSQDYKEALKWYLLSASQGHLEAQFLAGGIYLDYYGKSSLQDYQEALKWYRLAALSGHEGAQLALGIMYGEGKGVLQDYIIAHMWFNIATVNGDMHAEGFRDKYSQKMTAEAIAKSQGMARRCLNRNYRDCSAN